MTIHLNISNLRIAFDTRYPEYIISRCKNYIAEPTANPDLELRATEENIRLANRDNVGLKEAELYAMTIPMSEQLPMLGRLMTHGVAITFGGKSYIFTAESGVGKSTHAFLWQRYLGEDRVEIINGDKPIIWFKENGEIVSCGTPWSGKEHLDKNVCAPLGAICLLKRTDNACPNPRIERASKEEAFDFLMHQIFLPQSPAAQLETFNLLDTLYTKIPIYNLTVNMTREAVMLAFDTITANHRNDSTIDPK